MLSDPVPIGEHEPCGGSAACGWFAAQDHDTVVAQLDHVHEVSWTAAGQFACKDPRAWSGTRSLTKRRRKRRREKKVQEAAATKQEGVQVSLLFFCTDFCAVEHCINNEICTWTVSSVVLTIHNAWPLHQGARVQADATFLSCTPMHNAGRCQTPELHSDA